MKFGIRFRFAMWLLAALLPVSIAAVYVFGRVEDEVSARIAADLEGVRRLEAARIENALELYRIRGRNLASGEHVRQFTASVVQARVAGGAASPIAGYDGFDRIDPFAESPLQQLATALLRRANSTTADIAALQLQAPDGTVLGETAGFDWAPTDPDIVARSVSSQTALIGDAYRDGQGNDRLGVVIPIVSDANETVGVLVLESELGPIVDLVAEHEMFGTTREAHLVQPTPAGGAQFITPLRFERDAAFNKIVPTAEWRPISQSLLTPNGMIVFAPDYRGEESILAIETIEDTGWGLVVKMDRAEALEPVFNYTGALKAVAIFGVLGVLIGWAAFLDPIARRLRRMAEAAERVSAGEYDRPLDDRSSDEIGTVARSIDRLATDLATDIAVRTDIEGRLRKQATQDATTGLFNRQYATWLMQELAGGVIKTDVANEAPFSLLFLDLDSFKAINDVYGHGTGDAVLRTTGERLAEVVGTRGSVARWGGDEFVLVLPGMSEGAAQDVASEVQRALDAPVATATAVHQVRASVGVATWRPGGSLEHLLHTADQAMFTEKQNRSGRRSVSPESVRAVEHALDTDTVEVWFQPLVGGTEESLLLRGAEALVRLHDANGNVIAPDAFLSDVERSHVGRDLDRRVLRKAISQVASWIDQGLLVDDFLLSVNCCEALMRDADTVGYIQATLEEFGLQPRNLMLEISEKSSTLQPRVIDELGRLGVKIAVDDLGLSNSNIDRLLDGGASVAKIDGRWLEAESNSAEANRAVLEHLVSLCDALGFAVVAEGVETPEQFDRMRELGVSQFQGYLFAHPLSTTDFSDRFLQ